jgi:hypothetical protein
MRRNCSATSNETIPMRLAEVRHSKVGWYIPDGLVCQHIAPGGPGQTANHVIYLPLSSKDRKHTKVRGEPHRHDSPVKVAQPA